MECATRWSKKLQIDKTLGGIYPCRDVSIYLTRSRLNDFTYAHAYE